MYGLCMKITFQQQHRNIKLRIFHNWHRQWALFDLAVIWWVSRKKLFLTYITCMHMTTIDGVRGSINMRVLKKFQTYSNPSNWQLFTLSRVKSENAVNCFINFFILPQTVTASSSDFLLSFYFSRFSSSLRSNCGN